MPIEIDASVPIDNLEGGSLGGQQLLEREGLRSAVAQTVTNISAYVSILSSLIMGKGGGLQGTGVSMPGMSPKAVQKSFIIPSCLPRFLPPPPASAEVNNTLISILSY